MSTIAAHPSDDEVARRRREKAARRKVGRWLKRIALAILALAAAAILANAWIPKPVEVDAGVARRGTLQVLVEEDGRTRVRDRYVVQAPVSGTLHRIELKEGAQVAGGAVVARIRPPDPSLLDERTRADLEARLVAARGREQQAASTFTRARAAHDLAARELDRSRRLGDAATDAERERAESQERIAAAELTTTAQGRDVAAAEVRSIRASLGQLGRRQVADVLVTSPAAGRLLRLDRESEGPVLAGAPLVEVGDPAAIEVVVDVLSSQAVQVEPGQPATIEQWGGEPLLARVTRIEPSAFTKISALGVEEQRVNVILLLDHPPRSLGDGFRVEARIRVWEGKDVLVIPASAVFRDHEAWAVYAITEGRARLRRVELGHRGRLDVQIERGLEDATPVVLYPGDAVHEGIKLRARK